jgi:hypothetical protein
VGWAVVVARHDRLLGRAHAVPRVGSAVIEDGLGGLEAGLDGSVIAQLDVVCREVGMEFRTDQAERRSQKRSQSC